MDARRFALGLATAAVLTVLMAIHFLPDRVSLALGERSPSEVRAPRSVPYVDTEATRRRAEDAARRIPNSYDTDRTARADAARYVADLFETVRRVRALPGPATHRLERLTAELGSVFTLPQMQRLLTAPPDLVDHLQSVADRLVDARMSLPIRSDTDDLQRARHAYNLRTVQEVGAATDVAILQAIGQRALRPNEVVNAARTWSLREAEMRRVQPVIGEVRAGEVILHEGEVFTQLHRDKAKALGLISPRLDVVTALSIAALAGGMVLLVGYYIRRRRPDIYASPRRLVLLSAIVVTSVLGLKLFGQALGIPLSIAQFGYLGMMMVVAAGMMIAVLLDAPLAILVTALLSVESGLIMNHELRFSVMTLISSLVGIYSISTMRHRTELLRATVAVGLTNLTLVWVMGGLLGDTLREVATGSAWAVLAGVIGVGLFGFGVTVLEKPFGILTHPWLLELSASEHPLLRELCVVAPGTYAHSIMVGNLAEAAADAIGADSLLCRVASYYHDIGKMKRPHCFVENQHAENIHTRLNPSLSALIIASHVRDGLEMASQYRLPDPIKAIIAEHHGTSLIQYFYNQAVAEAGDDSRRDPVLEQRFRYEGPRPQTRESGIIMLADTVEAAVRCLDKPTHARVQARIEELIQQKIADGQLDECDLTFRDIHRIRATFARLLTAMLHGRIDYPDLPKLSPGLAEQGLKIDGVDAAGVPAADALELCATDLADAVPTLDRAALQEAVHETRPDTPHPPKRADADARHYPELSQVSQARSEGGAPPARGARHPEV